MKFRVKWWRRNKPNKTYHGRLQDDLDNVKACVNYGNKEYPELKHIVEEVDDSPNNISDESEEPKAN